MSKSRIVGIDVARALAIIGMIIVNFKVVLGEQGSPWLTAFTATFDGKAAATFVVLAGVGVALMANNALNTNNHKKLALIRRKIVKRAVFLLIVGTLYLPIWPADILHFYGIYLLVLLLLLGSTEKVILCGAALLIVAFPLLITVWDYEHGWDFDTLRYINIWSPTDFLKNLFFNGFHPVVPWAAFILLGYWLGKQPLDNPQVNKKIFRISLVTIFAVQATSVGLINVLSDSAPQSGTELTEIFGTEPMPPLPIYMINGAATAFALITACITVAKRFKNSRIIHALTKTGQLALTFYVSHVIIGIGFIEALSAESLGSYPIEFSVFYALTFSLLCIIFAVFWTRFQTLGPIEWLMRKVTG